MPMFCSLNSLIAFVKDGDACKRCTNSSIEFTEMPLLPFTQLLPSNIKHDALHLDICELF